jgi:hypothetical protein
LIFDFSCFLFFFLNCSKCADRSLLLRSTFPILTLSFQNKAIEVFTNTILGHVLVSKSKDPIIAACVYLACRIENYPRTLDEVSFATGVDVKLISKMQQTIARQLQLSIGRLRPQHLVNRFATRVRCIHPVSVLAQEICQNLTLHELLETAAPQVVAAGSLVVAALMENQSMDITLLTSVALVSLAAVKAIYLSLYPLLATVIASPRINPAGRALLLARVKNLPKALDKSIQQGKLVVKVAKEDTRPATPVVVPSTKPAKSLGPADLLADLLNDLTAPVVAPAVSRVSENSLVALLQAQLPDSKSEDCNPPCLSEAPSKKRSLSASEAVADVVIKDESTTEPELLSPKRASASFVCEKGSKDQDLLGTQPDRKIQKLASANG